MTDQSDSVRIQINLYRIMLVMLAGILIIQYLHNRSLWIDEAMLALNVINRSPAGLLRVLDNHQVAPVLFLLAEKFFTGIFGDKEPALRILPLLSALLSLPLTYRLCVQLTGNRSLSLCALVLLGCTGSFVYYAAEVKQYSTDVLVLLSIYSAAFIDSPFLRRWRTLIISLLGAAAVFLSNTSVIALFTVGLLYGYRIWKEKKLRPAHWVPPLAWGVCFGINYLIFIKDHPYAQFMKNFWADTFMPLNIFGRPFHTWVDRTVVQVFRDLLPSLPGGYLFLGSLVLYLFSLVMMVRKKAFRLIFICLTPVMIHLLLSALKLYPFDLRLILYQTPLHLIILAYGIHTLSQFFSRPPVAMIAVTAMLSFKIFIDFPMDHDEVRPAMEYIGKHIDPSEKLYVSRGSTPPTQYYLQAYSTGVDPSQVIYGEPATNDGYAYLENMKNLHGRCWLLFSHMYPFNGSTIEEDKILAGLEKRGRVLQRFQSPGCHVYELSLQ